MLIVLAGSKQSGKSTGAKYILNELATKGNKDNIRIYSFANKLKDQVRDLFRVNWFQCYGDDDDKNTLTQIKWNDIFPILPKHEKTYWWNIILKRINDKQVTVYLTARELLQCWGAICRQLNPHCWIDACYKEIMDDVCEFAIIDDCRYDNEAQFLTEKKATIIHLKRNKFNCTHSSETGLKNFTPTFVIDNNDMTEYTKNQELTKILQELKLIP